MRNHQSPDHLALGTKERNEQELRDAMRSVVEAGGYKLALDMIADPTTELGNLYQLVLDGVGNADIGLKLRGQVLRLAQQVALQRT
jgi:hypothetical protein